MPQIFRPVSFYYDNKKVADAQTGDYKVNGGNESQIADGGWKGESDGAITTEFSIKTLVPVSGETIEPVRLILQRKYGVASMLIGGKRHEIDVKIISAGYSWDHKTGTVMGDLTFRGGEPRLAG